MNKYSILAVFISVIIILGSCKKDNPEPQVSAPGVVINELMPVNASVVADQNGEFDDWIELYNNRDTAVDLSGYYLSDSKTNPEKWALPEGSIILPDSFLIVWADGDTLQSGIHTNFKLSSLGETVVLSSPDLTELDRVKYPEQTEQFSYARIPNGTGEFVWLELPTFNNKNIQTP